MTSHTPRWRAWLDIAAAVSIIAASVSVLWVALSVRASIRSAPVSTQGASDTTPATFPLADTATMGDRRARVGVIEFSDFQCPFCSQFTRSTLSTALREYVQTGQAFVGFKHFPLETIHPLATSAAIAAECARRQGRFWEMHDAIFALSPSFRDEQLIKLPREVGLDLDLFEACRRGDGAKVVHADVQLGRSIGIRGTPTLLFGIRDELGTFTVLRRESGAISVVQFRAAIEATLAEFRSRVTIP